MLLVSAALTIATVLFISAPLREAKSSGVGEVRSEAAGTGPNVKPEQR